jgi:arabinofuranosyltransferase
MPITSRILVYSLLSLFSAALGLAVCQSLGMPLTGTDDANILFVYSRNLADGAGLVYNVGGERVEGFTSMLWMLIGAVGYLLTDTPYILFLIIQSVLIGAALAYALEFIRDYLSARLIKPGPARLLAWPGLTFLVWVAVAPGYFMWNVASMLDTGLWSSLVLFATVRVLRLVEEGPAKRPATISLSLLFGMMVLSRPEAIAWGLMFIALLLLILRNSGIRGPKFWRQLLIPAASFALTLLLLTAFREFYFGYPLPNTYYAKMSPDTLYNLRWGAGYFLQYARHSVFVVIAIVMAFVCLFRYLWPTLHCFFINDKPQQPVEQATFVIGASTITGIILPILMGGDIFGAFRFYQPVWPLLMLAVLYAVAPWVASLPRLNNVLSRPAGAGALAVVLLAVSLVGSTLNWWNFHQDKIWLRTQFQLVEHGHTVAANVEGMFGPLGEPLPSIGVSAAGGIKMGYRGQVTDLMGLNFTPMAHHGGSIQGEHGHAAFSKEVFWQYPTDLVEPELCAPDTNRNRMLSPKFWQHRILRGMPLDADFKDKYTYVVIDVPDQTRSLCTYVSNSLLSRMEASGRFSLRFPDRVRTESSAG